MTGTIATRNSASATQHAGDDDDHRAGRARGRAASKNSHDRVEADGEEQRDHDQDQRRADRRDLGRSQKATQRAEAPTKPTKNGEWWSSGGRARRGRRACAAAVVGAVGCPRPGSARRAGSGCVLAAVRAVPAPEAQALLVVAEAGHDVAQRGELGGDRVAALGQPVDLGPEGGELALGSASPLTRRSTRPGCWPTLTICSASRRARAEQRLGLGLRPAGACVGGLLVASRARCSAAVARCLGLLDQPLGLGRARWCGARWPRGRAAPSPRPACGGPPGPRGRRRPGPARPRAGRRCAARWSPAAAASRSWSASRWARGQQVVGLGSWRGLRSCSASAISAGAASRRAP